VSQTTPTPRPSLAERGLVAVAAIKTSGQIIYGRGFAPRFLTGKVRPAPREPGITHYGCSCCRWTA
jgi:hypothetical protein